MGGVHTYIQCLRDYLESRGHVVDIIAHQPGMREVYRSGDQWIEDKWIQKDQLLPAWHKQSGGSRWIDGRELEFWAYAEALMRFDLGRYDILHAQDIFSARALRRVKPAAVPLLVTLHGSLYHQWRVTGDIRHLTEDEQQYLLWLEQQGALAGDRVIVSSEWLRSEVMKQGADPERVAIIRYGLSGNRFAARSEEKPAKPATRTHPVIACPARLVPIKGHRGLLRAAQLVIDQRPNTQFWLIGDGPLRTDLEKEAETMGLSQSVRFLGDRDDVAGLLDQSDIMVLPSLLDNQPFVIIEAQMLGKPVVANQTGGIPEMVEEGVTGYIVNFSDPEQVVDKLIKLLDDEQLRKKMGLAAVYRAVRKWPLHRMGKQTELQYHLALEDTTSNETIGIAGSHHRQWSNVKMPAPPDERGELIIRGSETINWFQLLDPNLVPVIWGDFSAGEQVHEKRVPLLAYTLVYRSNGKLQQRKVKFTDQLTIVDLMEGGNRC